MARPRFGQLARNTRSPRRRRNLGACGSTPCACTRCGCPAEWRASRACAGRAIDPLGVGVGVRRRRSPRRAACARRAGRRPRASTSRRRPCTRAATVEPLEIAQRLETGDAQSALAHGAHAGVGTGRMRRRRRPRRSSPARSPRRAPRRACARACPRATPCPCRNRRRSSLRRGAARARCARARTSRCRGRARVSAPRSLVWTLSEARNSTPRFSSAATVPRTSGVPRPMRCRCSSQGTNRGRRRRARSAAGRSCGTGSRAAVPWA